MNIWIDLPNRPRRRLSARPRPAGRESTTFPGVIFPCRGPLDSGLRLSFAGLDPNEIRKGIEILGKLIRDATESRDERALRPELALV